MQKLMLEEIKFTMTLTPWLNAKIHEVCNVTGESKQEYIRRMLYLIMNEELIPKKNADENERPAPNN